MSYTLSSEAYISNILNNNILTNLLAQAGFFIIWKEITENDRRKLR